MADPGGQRGWMQGALFHDAFVALDLSTELPTFVSEGARTARYGRPSLG